MPAFARLSFITPADFSVRDFRVGAFAANRNAGVVRPRRLKKSIDRRSSV
jgi:hypothetical protein